MPKRIQLKRTKGWRMPRNTVKVDRTSKWGNPYIVGKHGSIGQCLKMYRELLEGSPKMMHHLPSIRGKNLACWCKPGDPCHADVLLEFANRKEPCEEQWRYGRVFYGPTQYGDVINIVDRLGKSKIPFRMVCQVVDGIKQATITVSESDLHLLPQCQRSLDDEVNGRYFPTGEERGFSIWGIKENGSTTP